MTTSAIKTSHGTFIATFTEHGLARLSFPATHKVGRGVLTAPRTRGNITNGKIAGQQDKSSPRRAGDSAPYRLWQTATAKALKQSLAGKSPKTLPPLDLTSGTEFQRKVWSALQKISSGKTRSYSEVATAVGKPKAARAVGSACGANPIPVLIPCHRVLAANKKLGGFSGGLNWKRVLLSGEGISLDRTL